MKNPFVRRLAMSGLLLFSAISGTLAPFGRAAADDPISVDEGSVRIGTDLQVKGKAVASSFEDGEGTVMPQGGIIMWHGAVNEIPMGWALCDGTNGTPDLRDRFVVGAGGRHSPGETGGAEMVKLEIANMPRHNHVNGEYKYLSKCNTQYTSNGGSLDNVGYPEPNLIIVDQVLDSGGDQPHENRPPYYAICFIMKKR
jgi:microcystin-dependent protein